MKAYVTPEIEMTDFDAEDIITASSIVTNSQPQTFTGAVSLGDQAYVDVFGE